jgi:hypothetical protein
MKPVLMLTALAALAGLTIDTAEAAQRPRTVHRIHGHRVAHPRHLQNLKNGKHHRHTARSGHRIHAHVHNRKLHSLHVTDRNNRPVAVHKKFVRRARRGAAASPLANDLIAQELARTDLAGEQFTATAQVSIQVFVVFTFQINGQTVLIFFPASSVVGGNTIVNINTLPVDPNIPDDPGDVDGGDDLGF